MAHIEVSTVISAPRPEVFDLLTDPKRLPALLSQHLEVTVETPNVPLKRGSEFQFTMTRFGLSQKIRLKVEDYLKDSRLVYRQAEGLFESWTHIVRCEDYGDRQTLVTDLVDYQVPLGLLGFIADDLYVKRDMRQILESRLERAKELVHSHKEVSQ